MSFIQFVPAEPKRKAPTHPSANTSIQGKNAKVEHQEDTSIHNVRELRSRIQQIRSGWFSGESKRQNSDYNPSEHDKIKFNINLYLGQCLQFFVDEPSEATALVLDSEDLGSSATLAAFELQPSHIYVPNYWKGGTEYSLMKERLPTLGCFPISLENFIRAFGESTDTDSFRVQLTQKMARTSYTGNAPGIVTPLPERFEHLDFSYLDYCNKFMNTTGINNAETVSYMFRRNMFSRTSPFVLAVTGSLHAVTLADLNDELLRYKSFVTKAASDNSYTIREDQFFVYNRSHQEGGVEESLAHKKENFDIVPTDVHLHTQSHSSKMFFMSFVGNAPPEKLRQWDALFETCGSGKCKLQFAHRECLYQRGKDRLHLSKPFCNYRITDLYFWDPHFVGYDDLETLLTAFAPVPRFGSDMDEDVDALEICNKRVDLPEGMFKTFKVTPGTIIEVIDMTKVIEITRSARSGRNSIQYWGKKFELDSFYHIKTPVVSGKVSIECILGNIIGIHFTQSSHIHIDGVEEMKASCFLIQVDDFIKMLDDVPSDGGGESKSDIRMSDSESDSDSDDSDSHDSDSDDSDSDVIPYNLHYWGESRLRNLGLDTLRQLCRDREIEITDGAHTDTCIRKLLEWKDRQ
tara:strand:+ start:11 stop:1906 length:1896 start_codon:yes stop_codon:yes gene_type:complete